MPSPKPIVVYKRETANQGNVTVFHDPSQYGKSWPFGTVPEGVEKMGWLTLKEAKALATRLEADFHER